MGIGIDKKLAAGDLVKGTVRYISEFGLFIETAEGIEGLLHINKMDSSLNSKEQLVLEKIHCKQIHFRSEHLL